MTRRCSVLIPSLLISLATACTSMPQISAAPGTTDSDTYFGLSEKQSIEVCKPEGEREYLARLVCPDGSHPSFKRIGSMGTRNEFPAHMSKDDRMKIMEDNMQFKELKTGAIDYHVIDGYSVECGKTEVTLYLDMYHCNLSRPTSAPNGFVIIK